MSYCVATGISDRTPDQLGFSHELDENFMRKQGIIKSGASLAGYVTSYNRKNRPKDRDWPQYIPKYLSKRQKT